ncbi:Uridine 5'-monophosphate synthase [Taenia solium]|eukprot:TsM_000380200 transcript=TsM_000380200 gene=TsM_000380200
MYAQVPSCPIIDDATRCELAHRLFRLGALDFSGVRLRTGEISPVYFDIRLTMSDPALLQDIARYMYRMVTNATDDRFDLVTGVPAAAIALATVISIQNNLPMILTRKAAKDYGTKKMIEGVWKAGEDVLVVEDVVTYGDSITETISLLRSSGLRVKHAVVVVERQQGASQNLLENYNIHLHALLSFDDILNVLSTNGLIPMERVHIARTFIAGCQFDRRQLTAKSVINFCPPLASRLSEIMALKASKTCLLIDLPLPSEQLLQVVKDAAPRIAALEICLNLVDDTFPQLAVQLRDLADKHKFLLIANHKMTDDKCTDESHLSLYRWADIVIVHALLGSGILNALRRLNKASPDRTIGALLIADMEYKSSLMEAAYTEECIELAKKNADVVVGFVASHPLDSISLPTSPEGDVVPSVIYKTLPEHSYIGEEVNGRINGYCNGSTMATAFEGSCVGVLRTTCLSTLKEGKVDAL